MSIFSIGVSGLNTAQVALQTTSNNISNVYTPGYNRELTLLSEQKIGGGVRVTDIQRQFDYFISAQLNTASSRSSALASQQQQINQIDNLLADREAGLAPLMQNFFSALQDLAATPSDPAARQGVIGAADTLTAQFRSFDSYLADIQSNIGIQIKSEITQINNSVRLIADLNHEIIIARAKNGEAPNGLLNDRDRLVAELSTRLDIRLHIQDGGSYNITIGNGQPLVAGTHAYSLAAMSAAADPTRVVAGYIDSAGNQLEMKESSFTGGTLGGLMTFRAETLDTVQNQIGLLAAEMALAFNQQHQAGFDLNGDPGAVFFAISAPLAFSNENNTGTAEFAGAVFATPVDPLSRLTGSDYDIRVTNAGTGEFLVTRRDGGGSATYTLGGAGSDELAFDGLVLTIDDPALLINGDKFRLQPTRRAAGGFENEIRDTGLIAAAAAAGATGDNENALALQNLQNSATLVGGKGTLNQAYAALVGDVGNRTNIVQVNYSAQQSLTDQLRMVQQSESGVNLDEEAANLIRYQQYYQANARVIEAGAKILDTLLGLRA